MRFWQKPEFKALQRDWYNKLEELGHIDEEWLLENGELHLKANPVSRGRLTSLQIKNGLNYFTALWEKIGAELFESDVDRIILELYGGGARIKEIEEYLANRDQRRARNTIRFIIRKYEHKWEIKQYTRKQLNLK